jgi:KipI family sensor histidine kinase inhibitor
MVTDPQPDAAFEPRLSTAGADGMLVTFGAALNEPANRAALAFRAAVERADLPGIEETSTTLVSTYLRFDPRAADHASLDAQLRALLMSRNWFEADLPTGRTRWHVPAVFGSDLAPQLGEAADAAGLSEAEAVRSITEADLRVQAIGFAPGQPYIGSLPEAWDIPRQTALTEKVPEGALCVAIRQLVLFSVSSTTGWRHVAQTAFRLFRPERADPFVLRPGDGIRFHAVGADDYPALCADPDGGVWSEPLA